MTRAQSNTEPVIDTDAAVAHLRGLGYRVLTPDQVKASTRPTTAKADPAEVAAFFSATCLTRKELADAVGVSVGVIATVQNPNGDRWSQQIFDQRKPIIVQYAVDHKVISEEDGLRLLGIEPEPVETEVEAEVEGETPAE